MSISSTVSKVPHSIPITIHYNNIHPNHVFYDLVGGKNVYERLPTEDINKLDKVSVSIARGINGEANKQYLILRFEVDDVPGLSTLSSDNQSTENFTDGSPDLANALKTISSVCQRPIKDLYIELLTESIVESNEMCIKLMY